MKKDIWITQSVYSQGGFALRVVQRQGREDYAVTAGPLEPIAEGDEVAPLLRLRLDEAQQLLDELYRVGVRPSRSEPTSQVVERMEHHIEDLRRIAFKDANHPPGGGEG